MNSITSTKRVVSAYVQVCGKWKLYEHNTNMRYSSTATINKEFKASSQGLHEILGFHSNFIEDSGLLGSDTASHPRIPESSSSLLSSRPVHNFISHL